MDLKIITSINSTIKMYQFKKKQNGLFSDYLLNTLIPLGDEPPLKYVIHLNFPEQP